MTATVDSIPLIAASIMSKKLAAGSDKIVLDVTVGSGAFMKKAEDAVTLAEKMVAIGEGAGRETVAILSNMDVPLGEAVGNDIEILEAIETLNGGGPSDFKEICEVFATEMLVLSGIGSESECRELIKKAIHEKTALEKFARMVKEQGGEERFIYEPERFTEAAYKKEFVAEQDGYISHMDTELCGKTSVILGAGRATKESEIDSKAGIRFYKKTGAYVKKGEVLAMLYASDEKKAEEACEYLKAGYEYSEEKPLVQKEIIAKVTKKGVFYTH